MEFMLKKLLIKVLEDCILRLKGDNSNLTEEEMIKAIEVLNTANTDRGMSKEAACMYLNMSRSTFDSYVQQGLFPKGEKKLGFKELQWSKVELDLAVEKIKSQTN